MNCWTKHCQTSQRFPIGKFYILKIKTYEFLLGWLWIVEILWLHYTFCWKKACAWMRCLNEKNVYGLKIVKIKKKNEI